MKKLLKDYESCRNIDSECSLVSTMLDEVSVEKIFLCEYC